MPLDSSEVLEIRCRERHTLRQGLQEIMTIYYHFSSYLENSPQEIPEKPLVLCEFLEIRCSDSHSLISGAY